MSAIYSLLKAIESVPPVGQYFHSFPSRRQRACHLGSEPNIWLQGHELFSVASKCSPPSIGEHWVHFPESHVGNSLTLHKR